MSSQYRASESTVLTGCCDEIQFEYSCYTCDETIPCLNCNEDDHVCDTLSTDSESYPHPVEHAQDHA